MLEFISDNLFIIIAVVLVIVVRTISASRKRAAASREDEAATENYPAKDEDDRTMSLGHWEVEKQTQPKPVPQPTYTRKTLEKAQTSSISLSEAPVFSFSSEKTPITAEVSSTEKAAKPVATAVLGQGQKASGLSALDHLPTLKKAVVFSEILSPPKALR
ncbi:MAG: hypothetical protein LBI14_00045 [Treponema sp.]|jgi:hypothetical protein|nr:hypothetical protein [Treponema sp.]